MMEDRKMTKLEYILLTFLNDCCTPGIVQYTF
jgi:hypothetical protein